MSREIETYLASMPHFSFLPKHEIRMIAEQSTVKNYTKGIILAEQGKTKISNIYIVKKGQLSVYNTKIKGTPLCGYIKQGEVFGGITLLMNGGVSLRTVKVEEDAIFYLIPKDIFLDLCARNKSFYEYFLENFSKHIFDPFLTALIETGQAKLFLEQIAPFTFLPEEEIEKVARSLSMVHYPKGTVLFIQGRSRVGYLYILQQGAAERYYEESGQKTMRGVLGEGDLYGGISMLLNDGISVRTLQVTEDSYFYLLSKKDFLNLCDRYQAFTEFFTDTFGKRMLDKSYAQIIARSMEPSREVMPLYNQQVLRICNRNPLKGKPDMTIQEAARLMQAENSSYMIIEAGDGHQAGIVTESDLTRKVIATGYDISRPVAKIMSHPLHAVDSRALVMEALMAMMKHNIKHLAVTEPGGKIVGVFSHREMLAAQGQSPVVMLKEISVAESPQELASQYRRLPAIVSGLIRNGAYARNINHLITAVSDAILKKLLHLVLNEIEPPPVGFAFMIMGSEGRGEQTLKTDQDNAIIFADSDLPQDEVKSYFLKLGTAVCDCLDMVGYRYCQGKIMASNPKWCQPLSVWKQYFSNWIHAAGAQDLLQASIFFDFRTGFGHQELVQELKSHLFGAVSNWSGFLRHLTENALHFKPPLGFFRNFVVESKGAHRNSFDIKQAMQPIVDFARIYALKYGVRQTNTLDRLYQLYLQGALNKEEYEEIEKAYSFLMQLRLVRQANAMRQGQEPNNFINPSRLTRVEQTMLKEIFKRIEKFQSKLNFEFIGIA